MVSVKASAAVSHVGKVRSTNQDSGFAGRGLFAVADGMGGHAGGDVASALAVKQLADVDRSFASAAEARLLVANAVHEAHRIINDTVREHPQLAGMGTTVTTLAVDDESVVVNHIGDSRLYLLRGTELSLITTDHTFVQRLVDAGRITEEEAMVHPRRSVLMRVLGDVESQPELDSLILDARDGDRWMLCSDGLSGVVAFDEIRSLMLGESAKQVADRLVRAALDEGAPDNVTVVVVDIGEPPAPERAPLVVGSAATPLAYSISGSGSKQRPLRLTPFRPTPVQEAHFEPAGEEYLDELIAEDRRRAVRRRAVWAVSVVVIVGILVGLGVAGYRWTQTRFFVGQEAGVVTIYRGIQQDLGPIKLSEPFESTDIVVGSLSEYDQSLIDETISANTLEEARAIVDRLASHRAQEKGAEQTPTPTPGATP